MTEPDRLMTSDEVADRLRISREWLIRRAKAGTGPPFVKVGRRYLWHEPVVEEWLRRHE